MIGSFGGCEMDLFRSATVAFGAVLAIVGAASASSPGGNESGCPLNIGTMDGFLDSLSKDRVKAVDLSHVLNSKTPDFFGDHDIYHFDHKTLVKDSGYSTGTFQTPEHFGTHVDAPVHFAKGAQPIDQISVKRLVVPAVVIDIRNQAETNPDCLLSEAMIQEWEKEHGRIPDNAAVLLLTGWSKRWDSEQQYRNLDSKNQMHFPSYSIEAVKFLIEQRKINAIGVDTLSIDPGISTTYPVHKISAQNNVYGIENLNNLDQLPAKGILLFCGVPALEGGTGCPARVVAIVDRPN